MIIPANSTYMGINVRISTHQGDTGAPNRYANVVFSGLSSKTMSLGTNDANTGYIEQIYGIGRIAS